jgi:hypothetical protein
MSFAIIHGIPEAWIEVTLGHITRAVQGTGRRPAARRRRLLAFQGHE